MNIKGEVKKPDFILIPYLVISEEGITPLDGLVYGLVYWYSKMRDETCTASNKTMANILSVNQGSIANSISRLSKHELIKVTLDENNQRIGIEALVAFSKLESFEPNPDEGGSLYDEGGVNPVMKATIRNNNKRIFNNVSKTKVKKRIEVDEETAYYAKTLATILNDTKSLSYYKIACSKYDPLMLLEKAQAIIADGGARFPGAVFVNWLKTKE